MIARQKLLQQNPSVHYFILMNDEKIRFSLQVHDLDKGMKVV